MSKSKKLIRTRAIAELSKPQADGQWSCPFEAEGSEKNVALLKFKIRKLALTLGLDVDIDMGNTPLPSKGIWPFKKKQARVNGIVVAPTKKQVQKSISEIEIIMYSSR